MKTNKPLIKGLILFLLLSFNLSTNECRAQISTTSFTTSSSGWYRLGGWTTGGKRGAARVVVSLNGGSYNPQAIVIDAWKNWTSTLKLDAEGINNYYIEQVRIVDDSGIYYVEAYFDRSITGSANIFLYKPKGYLDGFNLNSGSLPSGAGTVVLETGNIQFESRVTNDSRFLNDVFVDGNVGIGTTSPDKLLELSSTENTTLRLTSTQNFSSWQVGDVSSAIEFNSKDHSGGGPKVVGAIKAVADASTGSPMDLVFFTDNNAGNLSEALRIDHNQNLGIGTTTPSEKLEVNGTIRSKEVKVEASPWPDYVFADNYQLTTLEELEAFIKSNKHLPEVPSASDVEANGLKLGEMNALLLKKIEELTLYAIEQEDELQVVSGKLQVMEIENEELRIENGEVMEKLRIENEELRMKNDSQQKKLDANSLKLEALLQRIEKLEK